MTVRVAGMPLAKLVEVYCIVSQGCWLEVGILAIYQHITDLSAVSMYCMLSGLCDSYYNQPC